ncbi:MAG: TolC family protein [Candidatus Eremiobacterota bacterium]
MRVLLLLLLVVRAAWAEPLTVEAAIAEALANSPAVREAEARVEETRYGVDEADAQGNPQLSASAGYRYGTPTVSFQTLPVVVNHNYEFQVGLQQALATFGRLEWATATAELRRRSQEEGVRREREELRVQVRESFANLWFARESVEVARELVRARREHLQVVETRLKAGSVARYDQIASRAAAAEAEDRLVQAVSQEALARAQLLMLLGRPLDGELELAGVFQPEEGLPDPTAATERALVRRPELTALNLAVEAAQARVHLEESQDNPLLSFSTQYSVRNATAFQTDTFWSTGVLLSIPLFDGGTSAARAGQARAVVTQLEQSRERLQRLVRLEVQQTFQLLFTAGERRHLALARLEQTAEGVRIARLRYQAGVSTNQEVLDAETAHSQSLLDLRRTELDRRVAWARWERATSGP